MKAIPPLRWIAPVALAFAALAATAAVPAWAAPPARLSEADARFLLARTGFAPDQREVDRLTGQPGSRAVDDIIRAAQAATPLHPPPEFVAGPPPVPYRLLKTKPEQDAQRQQQLREGLELKGWWLREMIETPAPLRERMTLFWHNHFATSLQKVTYAQALWRQQGLLRAQALGNFSSLLHGVAKDPAMLVYLDGAASRKEAPNENFAREVMELFTLGEATQGGGYTEQDIKEAARAFTGWSVERDDFSFRMRPAFHDTGVKTLLGQSGNFDGDQALDVLLAQPAAARFVVTKLWKEFVSPTPDAAQVERIAARFRSSGYDIGTALHELLVSDAFWAPANRGSLIKSPVDLVVGTMRQFGFQYTDTTPFALKTAQLGQSLLAPPNVKGWPGQNDWIDATTLLERKRFTEQLFRAVELKGESPMAPIAMGPGGRVVDDAGARPLAVAMAPADAMNPTNSMSSTNPMNAAAAPDDAKAARRPMRQMQAEFGNAPTGRGSNQQMLRLLGRDGVMRVADGVARITFEPDRWLAQYGGYTDRVPTPEVRVRLAQTVLAVPPTQAIPDGTVGVAYLRSLTLDPAYQLK